MTITFPTPEQLEEHRRESANRKLSRFSLPALAWLAALPQWSEPLAEAAGFPAGDASLPELVDRFCAAGLAEQAESLDAEGRVHRSFWMPPGRRVDVGSYLQQSARGPVLVKDVQALAGAVESAVGSTPELDLPGMRHWVRVATRHLFDPSGLRLLTEVDDLIKAGRASDAVTLVGAAEALGDLLGEPMASAARRAQWRIDRGYREALDTASLRDYLPRPDVEDALVALVEGSGSPWAIHLLGQGGVGKTMAIRYLASGELMRRRGLRYLPVGRVDFDHLDPRYPERRPAELLLALATELAGFSTTRDALFTLRRLEDAALAVHEALSVPGAVADADAVHERLLADAIHAFAEFASRLGERVLLVLDTCEELAKLHAPGMPSRAVDRTFAILERVHELSPNVRVLLAGRRWLVPPPDRARGASEAGYPARPYLEVRPIGGFTADQAREYLRAGDPERRIGAQLMDAVLQRCAAPDGSVNPFDLACYRAWVLAEPGLDPGELLSAPGDPYVEQRIISRLTDPAIREALPLAVELGRFELAMIEPTLTRRGVEPQLAFAGLAAQEWVSAVSFHPDGRPRVMEVDEPLRPRVRAVLGADPSRFPVDRPQLGSDLAGMIDRAPVVEDLAIEAVEAALRLLPPEQAGQLWDRFERRIAEQDAWAWAVTVLPRAAAAEAERAEAGGPTILGAIRATQAAATLRLPGRPGLAALWDDVERLAPRHPDPALVTRLASRVAAGRPRTGRRVITLVAASGIAMPDDAAIAFCERITADLPALSVTSLRSFTEFLDRLLQQTTVAEVRVAGLLCQAAVLAFGREHERAVSRVESALEALRTSPALLTGPVPRHVDWIVPVRLLDRARLARVVLALRGGERPESFPLDTWTSEALSELADIDAERMVSACLALRLAWAPVDIAQLDMIARAEHYVPDRHPTHYWNHQVDTLCSTVAVGMAGIGLVQRGADALLKRREEAVTGGLDPVTALGCDAALVRLSRLARDQLTSSIPRLAREGGPDVRAESLAVLTLLGLASETSGPEPATHSYQEILDSTAVVHRLLENDARFLRELLSALSASPNIRSLVEGLALPPRLLAQVSLAEAELLAISRPRNGAHLLAVARDAFERAGDRWGAARASILLVVAEYRAGAFDPAQADRRQWADVDVDELGRGWAERIRFADDVLGGRLPKPGSSPELRGPEMPLTVRDAPTPAAPRPAPSPPSSSPAGEYLAAQPTASPRSAAPAARRVSRVPARTVAIVVALLVVIGVAVTVLLSSEQPATLIRPRPSGDPTVSSSGPTESSVGSTSPSPPRPSRTPTDVPTTSGSSVAGWVIAVGALATVVALLTGGLTLSRRRPDRRPPRRDTNNSDQDTAAVDPVAGTWRPCHVSLSPRGQLGYSLDVHRAAGRPLAELRTAAKELRAGGRPYLLTLIEAADDDGTVADRAPEQELGRIVPDVEGTLLLPVRTATSGTSFSRERVISEVRSVTVDYSGPAAFALPASPSRSSSLLGRVEIVVGTPLTTTAGWRLRVSAASSASQYLQPDYPPSSSSTSSSYAGHLERSASPGEILLGADDLLRRWAVLRVLAAEPVDGPPRPLGRQRPGMATMAAELAAGQKSLAVTVVPPLPDKLLRDVITTIHRRMTALDAPLQFGRILDLVHEVRTMIGKAEPPSAEPAANDRASFDVLLFV